MISFDDFRQEWETHRVADDSLVINREETNETKFQCVSLIKQYLRECYGIEAGAWGNAIHYWTRTAAPILTKFNQVSNSEAQKGDIVILWGVNNNPLGHIGIATGGSTPSQVEILEQNGQTGNGTGTGGDAIRVRYVARSRVAGLLRPIPAPVPLPSPFTLSLFSAPKWVTVPAGTRRWHMDHRTFDEMNAHPVYAVANGANVQIQALASHINGEQYYLENPAIHEGYNVKDCPDYTPPPPVYTPPAAPVKAEPAEKYTLVKVLEFFDTARNAKERKKPQGLLADGEYIVVKKDEQAYQLVKRNIDRDVQWINTFDNKLEDVKPVPAPIPDVVVPTLPVDIAPAPVNLPVDVSDNSLPPQAPVKKLQYDWLRGDHQPVVFHTKNSQATPIKDLENPDTGRIAMLPPNKDISFSMVTIKNGMDYYIPTLSIKEGSRHGVPETMLQEVKQAGSFDANHDGKLNLEDIGYVIQDYIITPSTRMYASVIKPVIADIKKVDTTKAKKFIDGFSKRKVQ
jgi:hypothetical protein